MKEILFEPTYIKEDGLTVTKFDLPDGFEVKEHSVVSIPPGAKGGNHKHPRTEIFFAFGPLSLIWRDSAGNNQSIEMSSTKDGKLRLFIIPPGLPHVVINNSEREVILMEFADAEQHDVESVELV